MSSKGILVQNLTGKLEEMTERDITRLFEKFGEIAGVEIEMNPVTKRNQGFAIVKFVGAQSATNAIKDMNGYVVNGSPLLVTQLSPYLTMGTRPSRLVESESYKDRTALISKPNIIIHEKQAKYGVSTLDGDEIVREIVSDIKKNPFYQEEPTKVLGLFNLFDFQDRKTRENKTFLEELVDDVQR